MQLDINVKSVLIGLCAAALLNLLLLAGAAGFFLALTLAPLLAGYISSKYSLKKNSDLKKKLMTPIVIGAVWSIIQILLLVLLLSLILPWLSMKIGALEILIFILIFCFNICFCVLGNKLAYSEVENEKVGRG